MSESILEVREGGEDCVARSESGVGVHFARRGEARSPADGAKGRRARWNRQARAPYVCLIVLHAAGGDGCGLGLRDLGDDAVGGEERPRNRRGVLEGTPDHLGRVDDARLHQVLELASGGIVAAERTKAEGGSNQGPPQTSRAQKDNRLEKRAVCPRAVDSGQAGYVSGVGAAHPKLASGAS